MGVGQENNEEHDREGSDISSTLKLDHFCNKCEHFHDIIYYYTLEMVPASWAMVLLNEMNLKILTQPTKTVSAAAS